VKGRTEKAISDGKRSVIFNRGEKPVETSVYKRKLLKPGMIFNGPAIVEERETTSVIRPGWNVEVGDNGSLVAVKDSK
jgi:N-methylhydantoinase A